MGQIEFSILLLGAVALLAQLARLGNIPYPIVLVVGGLGIGFVPGLPNIELAPEIIFLVFLPPLLNSAAFFSSPRDLRAHLRPIVLLAVGLVVATTLAVAVVAHLVIGLPWAAAFVLGAILAPTDPVAAEAIFGRLGVPQRVSAIVGGESLINDGSALVAFRIARDIAVSAAAFSFVDAGGNFLLVAGGGVLVGVVLARVLLPLWALLRDPTIVVTVSVLLPYVVYVVAEEVLHVSGILAVVVHGLYQGWRAPRLFPDASTRLQAQAFWGVTIFLLDALLFILIGLQFPAILADLGEQDEGISTILLWALLVYGVVVGARMLWFFSVPYLHPVINVLTRDPYLRTPWQERLVMGWSGLRGAVSLAAALSVPITVQGGAPFPGREIILFVTFCVILATLILQGLTLPFMIRYLNLKEDGQAGKVQELRARLKGARAALEALEKLRVSDGEEVPDGGEVRDRKISDGAHDRMREYYEERVGRYSSGIEAGGTTDEYAGSSSAWRNWRRALIGAERDAILALRDGGEISPEVMRRIERDLDLEESRIGG